MSIWFRRERKIARIEKHATRAGLQTDVVRRIDSFDFVIFEEGRLERRVAFGDFDVPDLSQHLQFLGVPAFSAAEITVHAAFQRGRLSDIENLAVLRDHAVNPRPVGKRKTGRLFDSVFVTGRLLGGLREPDLQIGNARDADAVQFFDKALPDFESGSDMRFGPFDLSESQTEISR